MSAQQISLNQWRVHQWLRDKERWAPRRATAAVASNPVYVTHPALAAACANPQIPISITPLSATVEGMPNIQRPGMGPPQSNDYYHYKQRVHAPPAGISDLLNLRQVRGWCTMRVLSPNESLAGTSFSRQHTLFHQHFCELLAVPGLYRRILLQESISITPVANFRPLGGWIDNLTVEAVARHLAECVFSYAWADDCWDFAQAWVTDSHNDGHDLSTVCEHLGALDVNLRPAGHPHEPAWLVDFIALRPPLCPPSLNAGRPSRRETGLQGSKKRPARNDDAAALYQPRALTGVQRSSLPTAGPSSPGLTNPIPPFMVDTPVVTSTQPPPEPPTPFPGSLTVSLGGIITAPTYFPHHLPHEDTTSTSTSELAPSEVPSSVPDEDEIMDP
ncbi:hypothetical protein EYR40_002237 [Pleurotus pulmonarius]|nr:hypothetical protein EYR36_002270 [Pleurotus pulmonarius]KAF4583746.1 hypothetical protein EYR40_002237 [Pleurotus pulmonarius]